jgi:hypothetical protein
MFIEQLVIEVEKEKCLFINFNRKLERTMHIKNQLERSKTIV